MLAVEYRLMFDIAFCLGIIGTLTLKKNLGSLRRRILCHH